MNTYYGEPIEILFKRGCNVQIIYADGYEEMVPIADIEISSKKTKRSDFKRRFGSVARVDLINGLACVICSVIPSQNAHVRSRGAGGGWADIIPLCQEHHLEQHTLGNKSFQKKYSVDLTLIAKEYAGQYDQNGNYIKP